MAFDTQAARKAGYSDDEIADYLSSQSGFDAASARKAGYSSGEIIQAISARTSQPANDAKPDQGLTPLDTEQVTSARPWQGAGAGRGSPNDPRRVDVERKPEGGLLNEARQLRDETLMGVQQTGAAVSNINAFGQANRLANTEQLIRDLEARGRGDSRAANQLRAEVQSLQERLPSTIGTAADANALSQAASQMTTRPAIRKVGEAKTFGEAWEAFKESPYDVIAGVTAQSLPQVLPGLIAAAVTGPAAGAAAMGLNSGAVEFGGSLTEFAQDKGIDTRNAKAVQGFYSDPGNLSEALKYAGTRAGIIGTVDAASGGIAGKTLAPALRSPIKRQAINVPAQMAVQGAAGGGGEAAAQLATKGEIDQPGQVLLEVAGELGGAPAEVAAFTRDSARAATTPSAEAARALSTELDAGQLDPARVETLNPNLAIQRKTQNGLINIGAAQTVDEAIAAATQATSPQDRAVDNIARILGETTNVSQPGDVRPLDSGTSGLGAPEPGIGLEAGMGTDGAAGRPLDAGRAGNQPDGGTVPLGDGGTTPALSQDIADTASRIRELEGAPTTAARANPAIADPKSAIAQPSGEPASMWFGRRGDGYQTPEDASAALPSRQRIAPDLSWKVEQMPSGRYRLAGYDAQAQQPAPAFQVTLNPTGTATIIGDPAAIKATLAQAGIDKVMTGTDRVVVGTSQAQAAVQALEQKQPLALANTAQPAIESVANDQNNQTREDTQAKAPAAQAPAPAGGDAPGATAVPATAGAGMGVEAAGVGTALAPTGLRIVVNGKAYPIDSFKQASALSFQANKEAARRAGGRAQYQGWPEIVDANGLVVAHVGVGNKIIKGAAVEDGTPPKDKILYDPMDEVRAEIQATNPPKQDQTGGTPDVGAGVSQPMPVAAPQPKLFVEAGSQRFEVDSLQDAAVKWGKFRQQAAQNGGGASDIGNGIRVVDQDGKAVARISYNGRVWEPGENGKLLVEADGSAAPDPRLIPVSQRKQSDEQLPGFEPGDTLERFGPQGLKGNSWVLRNKTTGEVIQETSNPAIVRKLNTEKYEAVPVGRHLADLNDPTTPAYAAARNLPKKEAELNISAEPAQETPETAQVGPYGRDLTPIAQGGKPFKNKAEADKFRTATSNTLKTVRSPTGKGFAVMEKSAAEILRAERSAKRLRQPNTGTSGEPLHAHGFIAAEGGLSKAAMKDAGFDRNKRVGNRWMFSDTGMTIERATEKLIEAGYLRDGASHSDAFTLLNRSANQTPQYTPEGWERMAEAEQEARRLAAQDEANSDAQDFAKTAKMLGESELDELDYAVDNMPELFEAGARLTAEEADAIFEEHDANNESAVIEGDQELEQADARAAPPSRGPGDRAPGRTQEGQGSAEEGLTAPTQADVLAQQDRAAQAEELDQRAQIDREASGFQLQTQTAEQRRENTGDMFGGPSVEDYQSAVERNRKPGTAPEGPDLFGGLTEQEATSEEQRIENLRKQLVDVEDKIVGAAGMAPGFIEDAMKSRKVPKEQKDRRNDLKAELRAARQRLSEQTAEPAKPAAEMSAAELLRAAADKMEAAEQAQEAPADPEAAWTAMSPAARAAMLDKYFGAGLTDAGTRYASRAWQSFTPGEKSTLTAAMGLATKRDYFTVDRLDRETNQMAPVTFARGEYVEVTLIGTDKKVYGEIDGISQAKREFSVDGLWHPFGAAYKAERPAAAKPDTVPLSSVVDAVNEKYGAGLTEADRVFDTKLEAEEALWERINQGRATVEEFKAGFEAWVSGKPGIVAEFMDKKKDELLRMGGPYFAMRYKSETKPEIADALWREGLGSYGLGKSVTYSMGKDSYQNAVRRQVEATDAAELAQHAEDIKARQKEREQRAEQMAKAVEDPQTLADYESLIRAKAKEAGVTTLREARLLLTEEQRATFDRLAAEYTRAQRKDQKEERQAVRVAGQQVDGQIIETKHTQKGHDLFVVQLSERVSTEDYQTLNNNAKQMGGYYSSFRGRGAVAGFQFKDRATADAFVKLANGDTSEAQQAVDARRDAFADDRSQTAVERLTEMADRLEESADGRLSQDRKVNTERRARMAASAESAASADKAMAKTMRNIAQAISAGQANMLDRMRTKTQVEMLAGFVKTAKDTELRAKYPSYADQEKRKGQPATGETASYAEFPTFTAYRSDLASLGRQLLEVEGTKKIGTRLMKVADDVSDAYTKFAKENIGKVSQFMRGNDMAAFASKEIAERAIARSGLTGKAIVLPMKRGDNRIILSPSEAINRGVWTGDGDKRITLTNEFGRELVETIGRRANKTNRLTTPWQFETANDRLKALARMGIETAPEFRTALREFIGLQERAQEADRVKMLERAMVGRAKDGLDFFPTPESIADEMVETADIQPGMRVLEPSGGMGHIADRIRKTGAEPDVIELAPARRELLQAKGYELVGSDFMEFTAPLERGFTFGDLMRAPDGTMGILRGKGGMGSDRVQLVADNPEGEFLGYYNFSDLEGVERRGSISGYDRILMNPPFSDRRDAEHVKHAYDLLNPGGRLVAIMGEGVFFGQDKKAQDFREWLEKVGGTDEKLAEGTFMDPTLPVNTGVNARMVVIEKGEDGAMFSRAPAWRSELRDKLAEAKMEASKEEGWRAFIGGLKTKGVKPDEIEWSGVTDWLKLQPGKVTKQQVLDYLDANGVQVQEVVLGATGLDEGGGLYVARYRSEWAIYREDDGADADPVGGTFATEDDAQEALGAMREDGPTKYSQYTLPGGENYREVLLTLPEKTTADLARAEYEQWASKNGLTPNASYAEDRYKRETGKDAPPPRTLTAMAADKAMNYKSSHWDTPNVLAHIRLNDRTDADGKRVLFVEEIQSDWGQQGKKEGFAAPLKVVGFAWDDAKMDWVQVPDKDAQQFGAENPDPTRDAMFDTREEAEKKLSRKGIPLAPFVTSTDKWLTLALKRIITMASQEGYAKVAFVNGEQSAERYDLSKQVDTIGYLKHGDGTITIEAEKDGKTLSKDNYPATKIPDVVGKEIAQKIIDSPDDAGELSGLDLKVGGTGMIQFYDTILPNTLKDVLKKVGGGGLETVDIGIKERRIEGEQETPNGKPLGIVEHPRNGMLTIELDDGSYWGLYASSQGAAESRAQAEREFARISKAYREKTILQPGFTITDTIREKAAQGLPMFRAGDESTGMPLDKAQSIVKGLTKKWRNGPPIEVVATPADLPMEAPADANGMYYKGKVWVVASAHKTPEQISRTLGHEAIAHYGLRNILGTEEWRRFMGNINLALKSGNKPLKAIQARVREAYVDEQGRFNLTANQEADEIAAKVVEDAIGPDGEFRPGFGFVKSVYARIVEFLRDLGLDVKLTMAEVQGMLVLAQRNLEAGRRTGGGGEVVVAAARENGPNMARPSAQTDTQAFKSWFKGSKVVDAEGRPLVVYHGTTADFSVFQNAVQRGGDPMFAQTGLYFAEDSGLAGTYGGSDSGSVMPVYLNIRNPLDLNDTSTITGWKGAIAKSIAPRMAAKVMREEALRDGMSQSLITQSDRDKLVAAGYDGIKGAGGIWIAFRPEQIKSATGNRGTFDPADPNIMFSRGAVEEAPEQPPRPNMLARAVGYQSLDDAGSPEFTPGRMLYNLIGDATGPFLSKWSLKAASPELRKIMRAMKIDVAKAQETAAAVAKESMALSQDEREMVSDLIEKELRAGVVPPEHAIRLAATINTVMGKQTDELLQLGMLSRESAERWRGEYLPRFYESKLTEQAGDLWADAMRKLRGNGKPLKGIRGKHLRGRGMYEVIPVTQLADYETMGWEVRDPDYQPGLTDTGMVQVWRDFTRQERDRMGEIRDAGFRFVMGYMQTQKDIALGRMFEALASDPDMSSKYATEDLSVQVPTGNAPGTEVRTYGKLAGRFVSPKTLSQLSMIEEAQSEALMMYRKAMGLWKESKTVLNPVAHANNVISNITMAHFAGVSYGRVDKYLSAIKDFATKSDDVLEAKEAGLFLGTMNEAELFQSLPEELKALAQTQESTATKAGRTVFNLMSFYLRKPMGWAYQAEDTFFRYLIYKDARGRGLSPDDAVDYAQKFIFTYDDLPQGARRVRDYGIPFFAYTYKAIPALLETALTHPERFAAPMAVIMAANAAAYAIAAGDDDDSWELRLKKYLTDKEYREKVREKEKLERELLPEWLRGKTSLGTERTVRLGTDELTKLPMFIDISRMIPGGDMFDVHANAGGLPWPQPLTPNHPLLSTFGVMFLNKDAFYGKDIVDSNDTAAEASRKRLDWIWKQMTPAIGYGNYHWERWMNALSQATGEEVQWAPEWATDKAIATGIGRDGLPVQPKYAAMQTFGIKVRPYDLDKAEAIAQSVSNKTVREIDAEMSSLRRLNNMGAVSDRTYERAKELADTKKDRLRDGQTVDGDKR